MGGGPHLTRAATGDDKGETPTGKGQAMGLGLSIRITAGVVAAAALAGCGGGADPRAAGHPCGVAQDAVVTGPFCLTRAGVLQELERAVGDVRCEPMPVAGASITWPARLDRCRSGEVTFDMALYPDANAALGARKSFLARRGVEHPSHRARLSKNVLVLVDRQGGAALQLLRAVDELGVDVT